MTASRDRGTRLGSRLARVALEPVLWLFPPTFRRLYGCQMLAAYDDRVLDPSRTSSLPTVWLRTLLGLLSAAVKERLSSSTTRLPPQRARLPQGPRAGWKQLFEQLVQDFRFAFRSLYKEPGFTAVALITLGLSIGATTALFSVIDAVLLRPLAYPEPDRIVRFWNEYVGGGGNSVSAPDLDDIEHQTPAIEAAAGYSSMGFTMTELGEAEVVSGTITTGGLLRVFGLAPALGRDLLASDNLVDGPRVVVVSDAFWRLRLAADAGVLGTTLNLNGEVFEVVGVAPDGFSFPGDTQLWSPAFLDPEGCGRGCHVFRGVGRLADGSTLETARDQVATLAARLEADYPSSNVNKRFRLQTLADAEVGEVRRGLWLMFGAVVAVLMIACANIANLLLVRGVARRSELAVRAALGAGARRLGLQMLSESLLLGVLGGLLGLLVARLGIALLLWLAPPDLPRVEGVAIDPSVLAFALAVSIASAVLFGALPAWRAMRLSPVEDLGRAASRSTTAASGRSRSALLVLEVALSLVLLLGAGLLLRTHWEMARVDLGYETTEITRFVVSLPEASYEPEAMIRFFEDLETELKALPGVESVGAIFGSPLRGPSMSTDFDQLDRPEPPVGQSPETVVRIVTPGYLRTMRIPLVQGREFTADDRLDTAKVVLVSRALAAAHYPEGDVLGKQLRIHASFSLPEEPRTIVGVVEDVRSAAITELPTAEVYVPQAQFAADYMAVVLRGALRGELPSP